MASTLDVISDGRFELGIGSGWLKEEFTKYGIPFPKPAVRTAQLSEALKVIKSLWIKDRVTFQGKYYKLRDAICEPKPLQKPHPPIIVGGGGEKLTLRVVAKFGDVCNFGGSPEAYANRLNVLRKYSERVGRSFDEIERSWIGDFIIDVDQDALKRKIQEIKPKGEPLEDYVQANIVGTPEECLKKVEEYKILGVTYFTINGFTKITEKELGLIAERVMPSL